MIRKPDATGEVPRCQYLIDEGVATVTELLGVAANLDMRALQCRLRKRGRAAPGGS